jgi:hypothetical protein
MYTSPRYVEGIDTYDFPLTVPGRIEFFPRYIVKNVTVTLALRDFEKLEVGLIHFFPTRG